ncbi:hypothetical protein G6F68_015690 [Rhizopus microsporus]|nr:hypothetical protein G6F68_015690 [Rhizopus microsporus]
MKISGCSRISASSNQRWRFIVSFCTSEIDSWPPATTISMPSCVTCRAAVAIAISPDAHCRSSVIAGTCAGRPARSAAWRATFMCVVPCCKAAPRITSSTSPGATPARATACEIAWPPSGGAVVALNAPR